MHISSKMILELIFLVWTLLADVSGLSASSGCTTIGWFGCFCQYKCQCDQNLCDRDGGCIDGATCQRGWFGPACQYADLAVNARAIVLPQEKEVRELTDGDRFTCLPYSSSIQAVKLTWTTSYPFKWLRIHVNDSEVLNNFRVNFTSDTNESIECKNLRSATVSETVLDIHCQPIKKVMEVIISGDAVKALCSLHISGERNVALHQRATQSTLPTVTESWVSPGCCHPENAVDGRRETYSHTNNYIYNLPFPYWNLTLVRPQVINRIVIYNRPQDTYCCSERLKGFILTVSSDKTTTTHTDTLPETQDVYTVIPELQDQPVKTIRIQATFNYSDGIMLTLSEVEAYGDSACEPGWYGRECEKRCNCKLGECFVSTGGCPGGCAAGYYGESCDQLDQTTETFNLKLMTGIVGAVSLVTVASVGVASAVIIGKYKRKLTQQTQVKQNRERNDTQDVPVGDYLDITMADYQDITMADYQEIEVKDHMSDDYGVPVN